MFIEEKDSTLEERLKVYGFLSTGGNYHCYNVIGNCVFDLTSEQFGDEVLSYEENPQRFREVHFAKEEKKCLLYNEITKSCRPKWRSSDMNI